MPDKKDYALLEFMNEHMRDTLDELQKRPVQAVATALIFAMSELIHQRTKEKDLPDTLNELILEASKEALTLTDEVYLAKPASDTEIIH
jgi:hypothetical protein|tara:strand:+ start:59 stop:325 length:267 start_codon:yes stop_codon:yes gene_type:complete